MESAEKQKVKSKKRMAYPEPECIRKTNINCMKYASRSAEVLDVNEQWYPEVNSPDRTILMMLKNVEHEHELMWKTLDGETTAEEKYSPY